MGASLEVAGLTKSFGDMAAVRGLDFAVQPGQLFAFLGPNGAGKSTTINMLCTFLRPDRGRALINGYELGKQDGQIRASIGAVFQEGLLDRGLTVRENLLVRASFYGLNRAARGEAVLRAARAAGAGVLLDRRYGKLAGGQRRRADTARALVHAPRMLFLDEPTTGLDPQTRRGVWETVSALREQGTTVFLTTHYMEEAAAADAVVVIDAGRIAAQGTPAQLRERYARDQLRLFPADAAALSAALANLGLRPAQAGGGFILPLDHTLDALPILTACQPHLAGFEVVAGTMDDAFLGITGKEMEP